MRLRLPAIAAASAALVLAGCSTVRLEPKAPLPPPLIDRAPLAVAVAFPEEFRGYVHKEKRAGIDYEILLGPAHVERFEALLGAMFERVVEVDEPAAAAALDPPVRLVIEPRFEEFAFLTPSDLAGDYYTVTIRYRVELYAPNGERADGYVFTGFGRERTSTFSGTEPLARAAQRAMRDAGAKFAIEFMDQASVRRLLEIGGIEMLSVEDQLRGAGSGAGDSSGSPAGASSGPASAASPPGASPAAPAAGGGEDPPSADGETPASDEPSAVPTPSSSGAGESSGAWPPERDS